jgi:hypothetical protein
VSATIGSITGKQARHLCSVQARHHTNLAHAESALSIFNLVLRLMNERFAKDLFNLT